MPLFKKAWLLLSYKQKKYAIFIFVMMFFAMILESLSVGIVVPLISILLKGNIDSSILSYFFVFGKPTEKNLLYIGLSITLIIFLIKNLALTYNLWQQTKFLRELTYEFTNRLFKYYLKSDYIFFLHNNSAYLYRNLTDIISSFAAYVKGHMILLSEITVFLVLLLYYFI